MIINENGHGNKPVEQPKKQSKPKEEVKAVVVEEVKEDAKLK